METLTKTEKPRQTIIGNIYETYNYEMFTTLEGNRDTDKRHIIKLIASMEEVYLMSPIIVNKDLAIIDGQHRFEATKSLELPIRYIIDKDADLRAVQLLNAKSKDWSADDYLDSYVKLGYTEYNTYKAFKDLTKLQHNVCRFLLCSQSGGKSSDSFRSGTFKVTRLDHAYKVYELYVKCLEYYEGSKRRSFIYALNHLVQKKNFKADVFLKKLSKQQGKMYDCAKMEQYVDLIEEIYNYRNRNKINLRF